MFDMRIEGETVSGHTIDVLGELIRARSRELGESMRDAAVATMINALVSMRAQTRIAKRPQKTSSRYVVTLNNAYRPGYALRTDAGRRVYYPVFYIGGKGSTSWMEKLDRPIINPFRGTGRRKLRVFNLDPAPGYETRYKAKYLLAPTLAQARQCASEIARRRWAQYRGLAKFLLGKCAAQLSTRQRPGVAVTSRAKSVAEKNAIVVRRRTLTGAELVVHDALRYAKAAFMPGASVELALKKAANRTAGMINRRIVKRLGENLAAPIETPFPEVAK